MSPLATSDIRLEEIDPDWWNANAHWAIAAIAGIMLLISVIVSPQLSVYCIFAQLRKPLELSQACLRSQKHIIALI